MKLKLILNIVLLSIFASACNRQKVDSIGPALAIASSDFKFISPFKASDTNVNFSIDSLWFGAKFNEMVSWEITIKSNTSSAYKEIKGNSDFIDKSNSLWTGGHSGKYFFGAKEKVTATLKIFGKEENWEDNLSVSGQKNNYGSEVLVWNNMENIGIAKSGSVYWFSFFDDNEKVIDTIQAKKDPIEGVYRSFQGKDGKGLSNYYIGALTHTYLTTTQGFNESLDDIYLNFYLRKRTNTSAMNLSLTSVTPAMDTTLLNYDVGKIDWEDWKLVSFRLSDMTALATNKKAFNPAYLAQMSFYPEIHTSAGVDDTGFDIDFICFTRKEPFNPDKY